MKRMIIMKTTAANETMFNYEAEESSVMLIPIGLTLGTLIGLVCGELIFSSMAVGMIAGIAAGTVTGCVSAFRRLRAEKH